MAELFVHREFKGSYQCVGRLVDTGGSASFQYLDSYLDLPDASAISAVLPLDPHPFDAGKTRAVFQGLIPEGSLRRAVEDSLRIDRGNYLELLSGLRNEPIGALLFSEEEGVSGLPREYRQVGLDEIERFATASVSTALDLTLESRISLAGAQTKVGLYHHGNDGASGWYLPKGTAPSTHILKACAEAFPGETVCEALCMRTARELELDVADCYLLHVGSREPILVVERFDREIPRQGVELVGGLPVPRRLHHEDMCQAMGLAPEMKYEPSESNYLNMMANVLRRESADYNGDRFMLAYYELFDYLVGNCDNHLKNWAMVWDGDWGRKRLAPLYDVVNTTEYPSLVREMGVAFCPSRSIDDVSRSDVKARFKSAGIPPRIADIMIADLSSQIVPALESAAGALVAEGFPTVEEMLERMRPGVMGRVAALAA